ncbi:hypothetical protein YC2023_033085 [Brassica napus]
MMSPNEDPTKQVKHYCIMINQILKTPTSKSVKSCTAHQKTDLKLGKQIKQDDIMIQHPNDLSKSIQAIDL